MAIGVQGLPVAVTGLALEKGLKSSTPLGSVCSKPIRNPIPIMLGGGGEKVTLRLVAQYATISNTFGDPIHLLT